MLRIGHGYDIHQFELGKALVLGGVTIPFDKGMKAHSDGDVPLHAICDAMLGAAGLGDIGRHFSDTDPRYSGIDSRILLRRTAALIKEQGYEVQNIDATIIAEVPKLSPHIDSMRINIALDVGINESYVNIKATTMEKLGPIGQQEAIATHAVVLLRSLD